MCWLLYSWRKDPVPTKRVVLAQTQSDTDHNAEMTTLQLSVTHRHCALIVILLAHHTFECVSDTEELHMGYEPQASQPCIFLYSETQSYSLYYIPCGLL